METPPRVLDVKYFINQSFFFPSNCVPFKFAYRNEECVFVHGHTSLLYLICEALCSHVVLVIGPYLPLVCRTYKQTCLSDPEVRTIWNIPLDHLHLKWRQVFSAASLSHTHIADNSHPTLFNKHHLHF